MVLALPAKPSAVVQLSHWLVPSHRARPDPSNPIHIDPSRSSSAQETILTSKPRSEPMRSQPFLICRTRPYRLGTSRVPLRCKYKLPSVLASGILSTGTNDLLCLLLLNRRVELLIHRFPL